MTQLIVTPIDMSAPGSYLQRKRLLQAIKIIRDARATSDVDGLLEGMEKIEPAARAYHAYLKQVQQGQQAQYAYQRLKEWGYIK